MFSLAIETATDICSIAVSQDGTILGESTVFSSRKHSELLTILIRQTMENLHLPHDEIDDVLVSIGPGSFTGLRIGLSTAKGLVFANQTKLYAIPTLLASAWTVRELSNNVGVLHHSHRDMYFYAVYGMSHPENSFQVETAPLRDSWENLVEVIPEDLPVVIQGALPVDSNSMFSNSVLDRHGARAGNLIELHTAFPDHWKVDDPFTLEPDYLREYEAEKYRNPLEKKEISK